MKTIAGLFLLPLALLGSPGSEQLKQELIGVEHAFRDMVAAKGAPAAFAHFAAPDAAFFKPDPRQHRGPEAVTLRMKDWNPAASLRWEPMHAEASADGSLGYTWGRYEYSEPAEDPSKPPRKAEGFYLTVWKRQPDGSWRFTLDTGTPDKAP